MFSSNPSLMQMRFAISHQDPSPNPSTYLPHPPPAPDSFIQQEYKFQNNFFDTGISNIEKFRRSSNNEESSYGFGGSLGNLSNPSGISMGEGNIEDMFSRIDNTLSQINEVVEVREERGVGGSRARYGGGEGYQSQSRVREAEQQSYQFEKINTTNVSTTYNPSFQYNPSPQYSAPTTFYPKPIPQHHYPSSYNPPSQPSQSTSFSSSFHPPLPRPSPTNYSNDFTSPDILNKLRPENKSNIIRIKQNFETLRRQKQQLTASLNKTYSYERQEQRTASTGEFQRRGESEREMGSGGSWGGSYGGGGRGTGRETERGVEGSGGRSFYY